jgi:murein DD-endopeptidase / murein LD-carboxypeptidase
MIAPGILAILLSLPVNAPALERAIALVGSPYRFGGTTEKGFDCAGLVRHAYAAAGVTLPRTAALQFSRGLALSREELRPGDLVFFRDTYRKGISHVGIYIGGGEFIHAASTRRRVTTDRLDQAYYRTRFVGGRRLSPDA